MSSKTQKINETSSVRTRRMLLEDDDRNERQLNKSEQQKQQQEQVKDDVAISSKTRSASNSRLAHTNTNTNTNTNIDTNQTPLKTNAPSSNTRSVSNIRGYTNEPIVNVPASRSSRVRTNTVFFSPADTTNKNVTTSTPKIRSSSTSKPSQSVQNTDVSGSARKRSASTGRLPSGKQPTSQVPLNKDTSFVQNVFEASAVKENGVPKVVQGITQLTNIPPKPPHSIYITLQSTKPNKSSKWSVFNEVKSAALSDVASASLKFANKIANVKTSDEDVEARATRSDVANIWDKNIADLATKLTNTQDLASLTGFPSVKAIMDSACLGESVLVALNNNLCESMKPMSADFLSLVEIYSMKSNGSEQSGLEFVDFLLQMSYCDIYELVSSDRLGAVNGLYTIKAINDILPSFSYVSIPKSAGGQIGTSNDVFMFTNLLQMALMDSIVESSVPYAWSSFMQNLNTLVEQIRDELTNTMAFRVDLMFALNNIKRFREFMKECDGGFCNKEIIDRYFETLTFIQKFIVALSTIFTRLKSNAEYKKLYNHLLVSFGFRFVPQNPPNQNTIPSLNTKITLVKSDVASSAVISFDDLTWLGIQICRYNQTLKVYNSETPFDYSLGTQEFISYLETKKQKYADYLLQKKAEFETRWLNELQTVYIHEAFAGHDNKSQFLTVLGVARFRNRLGWIDVQSVDASGKKKNYSWGKIEHNIIKLIQQESECMFFQWTPIPRGAFGNDKVGDGILFGTNSDMVSNNKINGNSTPNGLPVLDIFVDSIGFGKIKSVYDLENYEGETVATEKGVALINPFLGEPTDAVNESLIESIVYGRGLDNQTRIQEIQGVISTLDRASRTNHPFTIYCTGQLNIPIKIPISTGARYDADGVIQMTLTYTYGSQQRAPVFWNESNTMSKYKLYTLADSLSSEKMDSSSPTEVLLNFLIEYNKTNKNALFRLYDELQTEWRKRIPARDLTPFGGKSGLSGSQFESYMSVFRNPATNPETNPTYNLILFVLVKITIDMYAEDLTKQSTTWNRRFGWLIQNRKKDVGKAMLTLFGEHNINPAEIYIKLINNENTFNIPSNPMYNVGTSAYLTYNFQQFIKNTYANQDSVVFVAKATRASDGGLTFTVPSSQERLQIVETQMAKDAVIEQTVEDETSILATISETGLEQASQIMTANQETVTEMVSDGIVDMDAEESIGPVSSSQSEYSELISFSQVEDDEFMNMIELSNRITDEKFQLKRLMDAKETLEYNVRTFTSQINKKKTILQEGYKRLKGFESVRLTDEEPIVDLDEQALKQRRGSALLGEDDLRRKLFAIQMEIKGLKEKLVFDQSELSKLTNEIQEKQTQIQQMETERGQLKSENYWRNDSFRGGDANSETVLSDKSVDNLCIIIYNKLIKRYTIFRYTDAFKAWFNKNQYKSKNWWQNAEETLKSDARFLALLPSQEKDVETKFNVLLRKNLLTLNDSDAITKAMDDAFANVPFFEKTNVVPFDFEKAFETNMQTVNVAGGSANKTKKNIKDRFKHTNTRRKMVDYNKKSKKRRVKRRHHSKKYK